MPGPHNLNLRFLSKHLSILIHKPQESLNMITILLILTLPIIISFSISTYTNQRIADLIPISYFFAVIWLYGFGVFDQLYLGYKLLFPFAILIFVITLVHKRQSINLDKIRQVLSPAVVLFILISTWMFKHSQQMRFKEWDEFSHWGPAVKSMYLFDKLGPFSPAQLVFPDYPPGLSLFAYLTTKTSSAFDESHVYWAYQVLILSIIAALLSHLTWRHKPAIILASVIAGLSSVLYFNSFQTIYADPFFGILFGFSLLLASSKEVINNRWNLINFVLASTLLSLTKDIGIYLSLLASLILLINLLINSKETVSKKSNYTFGISLFIISLIPILINKLLWANALKLNDIKPGRNFVEIISKALTGDLSSLKQPYWTEVTTSFVNKSLNQSVTSINSFPISPLKWIFIYATLFLISILISKSIRNKVYELLVASVVIFGFAGYLFIILFLYLTTFSQSEAIGLASYDRYIVTYFAGLAIYFAGKSILGVEDFSLRNSTPKVSLAWFLILLFQSSTWNLLSYVSAPNLYSDQIRAQYDGERYLIAEMNLSVEDNVWFIAQHTIGFEFYMFQYELLPASVGRAPWSIGTYYGPGDLWTDTNLTPKNWDSRLNDYDYVFVHSVTESFIKEFGDMFEEPETLSVPGFYRVEHLADGNRMVKVR
jgi:hypothetical protein